MKFSHMFLISTYIIVVPSSIYAGKHDLLHWTEEKYIKNVPLFKQANSLRSYIPKTPLPTETVLDLSNDRRIQIPETEKWPHSTTGQLTLHFSNGDSGHGSGILIGPHHFLTAGHCVDDRKLGRATRISVRLGLNGNDAPFGEVKVQRVYTFEEWDKKHNDENDIALLILNESIGLKTGWVGLKPVEDDKLRNENTNIILAGYPGDLGDIGVNKKPLCNRLWGMSGKIKKFQKDRISYDLDTNKGQSGSGLTIDDGEDIYAIGVHTHGTDNPIQGNSGVRLSQYKFNWIIGWMSESCMISPDNKEEAALACFRRTSSSEEWSKLIKIYNYLDQSDHNMDLIKKLKSMNKEYNLQILHEGKVKEFVDVYLENNTKSSKFALKCQELGYSHHALRISRNVLDKFAKKKLSYYSYKDNKIEDILILLKKMNDENSALTRFFLGTESLFKQAYHIYKESSSHPDIMKFLCNNNLRDWAETTARDYVDYEDDYYLRYKNKLCSNSHHFFCFCEERDWHYNSCSERKIENLVKYDFKDYARIVAERYALNCTTDDHSGEWFDFCLFQSTKKHKAQFLEEQGFNDIAMRLRGESNPCCVQ